MRASYERVRRRIKGIPRSSSRGGHNKKLNTPSLSALKDYLLICHSLGRSYSIDTTVALLTRFYGTVAKKEQPIDTRLRTRSNVRKLLSRLFDRLLYLRNDVRHTRNMIFKSTFKSSSTIERSRGF